MLHMHSGLLWWLMINNMPAMRETWVWSLGRENPLEKGIAVFLPGESHGQRSLVGYSPWGCKELDMTEQLTLSCIVCYMVIRL